MNINQYKLILFSLLLVFTSVSTGDEFKEEQLSSTTRYPEYLATTEILVIGGNLPKIKRTEQRRIHYAGRMVDVNGLSRTVNLFFSNSPDILNQWIMEVEIIGVDTLSFALKNEELEISAEQNTVWLDFANNGQLMRMMDMNGYVIDEGDATVYIRYRINEEEGDLRLYLGVFMQSGNFLTQYNGYALSTLRSNGYPKYKM
ncbi:hypothetical protein PVA44_00130 [Entomospira nematocerorum]|uniref:Uncharacterized protein n=1 Tax=Entomospira nematocerorum TaxID=2719987 RepID=A0A968KTM7_9SPIO|nr:hypothetical protein [Entomospira nematocera]NIZ47551.1 hypothetical protein [Entomospira nematocera]WDI33909.1 hypothetical protein PVA44_00130 [Entomospira nematocera]